MAGEPDLSPGDTSEWVTYLQQLLAHNDHPLPADGVYGDSTTQAVQAFQQAHGLSVTGTVDATTWGALTGEAQPQPGVDGATEGHDPGQSGVVQFDPAQFATILSFHGMTGEQHLAELGIEAPAADAGSP